MHIRWRGFELPSIVNVDEEAGLVYYTAHSGDNPMKLQLHCVRLDGTGSIAGRAVVVAGNNDTVAGITTSFAGNTAITVNTGVTGVQIAGASAVG